ncbi:unknown [Clostridium sp. CAG:58]|nr:unknown [Clostridium sp. CAG:58]
MIIPSTKRTMGEEPAVDRYSFVTTAIRNAPQIIPMISGRTYWTTAAWWSFMAPAVSRIKQAIHMAMFLGFPI